MRALVNDVGGGGATETVRVAYVRRMDAIKPIVIDS